MDLDPSKLARETEILKRSSKSFRKAESIIDKMIQGASENSTKKWYLLEQSFVMDDKLKIKDLLANFSKDNSATAISGFKLFVLGEGIEKKEENFAEEVASMTK